MIDRIVTMFGGGVLLFLFGTGMSKYYGSLSGAELNMVALTLMIALAFGIGFVLYALGQEEGK